MENTTKNEENAGKIGENVAKNGENLGNSGESWVQQELKGMDEYIQIGEKLPSLTLEEGVVTEFEVDFSKKWQEFTIKSLKNPEISVKKAIIPVILAGNRHIFWLNKANPVYRKLLQLGMAGQEIVPVKMLKTGTAANTKYLLVK